MTHSSYKKRLFTLQKRKGINIGKSHIKSIVTHSQDQPLIITGAQSIKKEEFIFPQYMQYHQSQDSDSESKFFHETMMVKISDLTKEIKEVKQELKNLKDVKDELKQIKALIKQQQPNTSLNNPHHSSIPMESQENDSVSYSPADMLDREPNLSLELPLDLPIELPIATEIDLDVLVDWVKEDMANENILALALITDGTHVDIADKVRMTLRKLMTRKMATLFNWEGRIRVNGPKKLSFLKTGLWKSVFMAISHNEDVNELQAAEVTKMWFKGANSRPKN